MIVYSKSLIKSLYYCFAMFTLTLIILALAGYLELPPSYSSGLTGPSDTTSHTSFVEEPFTEVLTAFRKWDAQVGCKKFREKYREKPTNGSSLQDPDGIACNSLKLNHVSILVKGWTWIPDSLNNLYSCRCGLSCLWTKSEVLVDEPEAVFFETTTPPFKAKLGPRANGVFIGCEVDGVLSYPPGLVLPVDLAYPPCMSFKGMRSAQVLGDTPQTWYLSRKSSALCDAAPQGMFLEALSKIQKEMVQGNLI